MSSRMIAVAHTDGFNRGIRPTPSGKCYTRQANLIVPCHAGANGPSKRDCAIPATNNICNGEDQWTCSTT